MIYIIDYSLFFGWFLLMITGNWWTQIFQLKVEGVALRLIPEASQIKNALKVRVMVAYGESTL